jgi:hypothetical protein
MRGVTVALNQVVLCCHFISNMQVRALLQAASWLVDVDYSWMAAK